MRRSAGILKKDGSEGVGPSDALGGWGGRVLNTALAEPSIFVGIGCIPNVFEFGVLMELTGGELPAGVRVNDGVGHVSR